MASESGVAWPSGGNEVGGEGYLNAAAGKNSRVSEESKERQPTTMTVGQRVGMREKEEFLANVGQHEKLRIVKNVVVLGIAFMVHFTAFHGTANLQSSVNSDASLGTFTLASIYGSLILSNIFLPVIVIRCVVFAINFRHRTFKTFKGADNLLEITYSGLN